MIQGKIDILQLTKLLAEGKRTKEIAKFFNCTTGAVSQMKKKLSFARAVDASTRMAPVLNDKSLNVMDRYVGLINRCFTDLEWIEGAVPPEATADYRDWLEQKKKHTGEIRKLISTFADIRTRIYQAEKIEKIIAIMMHQIGEEDIELQRRIAHRFREAGISFQTGG